MPCTLCMVSACGVCVCVCMCVCVCVYLCVHVHVCTCRWYVRIEGNNVITLPSTPHSLLPAEVSLPSLLHSVVNCTALSTCPGSGHQEYRPMQEFHSCPIPRDGGEELYACLAWGRRERRCCPVASAHLYGGNGLRIQENHKLGTGRTIVVQHCSLYY